MSQILNEMYTHKSDILHHWMEKLFPVENQGCINFGYWENIQMPLNTQKRIESQKNLYFKIFNQFNPSFKKTLEVGCGRGHGIFWLREMGYEAFGIDILEGQIAKSKENYPQFNTYFQIGKAEEIPFEDMSIDCIYSIEATQHFSSFDKFCKESFRILRNRGELFISTYFICQREYISSLASIIPNNLEGFHNAIVISEALETLETNGFKIKTSPLLIGKEVFPLYTASI